MYIHAWIFWWNFSGVLMHDRTGSPERGVNVNNRTGNSSGIYAGTLYWVASAGALFNEEMSRPWRCDFPESLLLSFSLDTLHTLDSGTIIDGCRSMTVWLGNGKAIRVIEKNLPGGHTHTHTENIFRLLNNAHNAAATQNLMPLC